MSSAKTVSEYIVAAPDKARPQLKRLRQVIRKAVPEAREWMSYGIPAYEYRVSGYDGRLIYFAAFKTHISLYPATKGLDKVPALKKYQVSVGTLHFPLDEKLPLSHITHFIKVRCRELDRIQKEKQKTVSKKNRQHGKKKR